MNGLPQYIAVPALIASLALPLVAEQQTPVAVFPVGSLSGGDRWIATGLSRDLVEKLLRTPELRPIPAERVNQKLMLVLGKKSKGPVWLPASAQRKIGQWLDADLILIGLVGSSGNRNEARRFLDGLSIVPAETPEGSEAWVAAKFVDLRLGQTVSWAFAEGSRQGFFELQDAIYLQLTSGIGIDPGGMARGTIGRPTESMKAYRLTLEAENLLLADIERKKRPNQWKRALKKLEQSLKLDATYAKTMMLIGKATENQGKFDRAAASYGRASALDPNYTAPRLAIAAMANRVGDNDAEMAALQSVLEAAPWHDGAYDRIGQTYERMGRTDLAAENYDRAIHLFDRDSNRLFRGGSAHLSLGQFDKAVLYLKRAVTRVPGKPPYHVRLIRTYTRAGQYDQAQTAVEVAAEIGVESTDLWLASGELALQKKDYAAAEAAFVRVLAEQPGRMDAQLMVAQLRLDRGDYQAAIAAYTTAIENGLPVEEVVEPLAAAYLALGQSGRADQLYRDALEKHPNVVTWLLARARLLIESLKHAEAIPLLRRVLDTEPDQQNATEWLAGAYAAVGNDSGAIQQYMRLLRIAPDRTHAYARLGGLHYRTRQFKAARDAYQMAIDGNLGTADIYAGLGLSEEELSRYRSARSAYRKAIERDRKNEIARAGLERMRSKIKAPRRQPSASEWAERGRRLRDSGDRDGAVSAFRKSLSRDSANPDVWNDLGMAYAGLNDTERARRAFKNTERLNPTSESVYNLGRLSFQEGKTSEAILNYQISLQRDATFLTAALNLSALQAGNDDPMSAIKTLKNARSHHPNSGAVTVSLANAYFQAGNLDRAAQLYGEAKSLNGALANATMGLGNVALTQGDTTGARMHYQDAIAADPNNPDPRVNLGTLLIRQGQYEEAVEVFRKALDLNPTDLALYLNLSVLYYHTEQYTEALEYCRAILEREPTLIEAQRLIGDIAIATSKLDLAVEAYGSALELSNDDPASLLGIAEALNALGRTDEAHDHWQRWLDTIGDDPSFETQIKTITRRLESDS